MINIFKKKSECHFCKNITKTDNYKYFNKQLDICNNCLFNTKKLQQIVERFNK